MTRRTSVLALLLLGGLLALVSSAQPWFRAVGIEGDTEPTGPGSGSVTFTGADSTGGLSQALAIVVLVGVLLSLVLATRGRRVLAVLLGLAGLGIAAVGALPQHPSAAAVRTRFRQFSLVEQFALESTAWSWVYALAGIAVIGGAVLLFVAAPSWPQHAQRFERRAPSTTPPTEARDDPAWAWGALDAGVDPTTAVDVGADRDNGNDADNGDDTTPGNHDPDVRTGATPDTMVDEEKSGAGRNLDPGTGSGGVSAPASRRRNEEL